MTEFDTNDGLGIRAPQSKAVWLAGIYIVLVVIRPWEILMPALSAFYPERSFAALMILACFSEGRTNPRLGPTTYALLAFLGMMLLSCFTAANQQLAFAEIYKYATLLVFHLVLLAAIRYPRDLIFILLCIVGAMFLYLAKAEWEFYMHGRLAFKQGVVRMHGIETTFGNANAFAASTVLSLPLWFLLNKYIAFLPGAHSRSISSLYSLGMKAHFLLAVVAVFESKSRTGLMALLAALLLIYIQIKSRVTRRIGICGAIAVAFVGSMQMEERDWNRIKTIVDSNAGPEAAAESAQGRIEGLKTGFAMLKDNPLLGVGPGNFIWVRQRIYDGLAVNPHNLVGQLMGELGVLGTLSFAWFVVTILLTCRSIRQVPETDLMPDLSSFLHDCGRACRDVTLLLLVTGVTGHNLSRMQWYWIPAIVSLVVSFQSALVCYESESEEVNWQPSKPEVAVE